MSGLLLALLLAVGVAVPAAAQGFEGASTATVATATQVSFSTTALAAALPANVSFIADADQQRAGTPNAPQHQVGDKQVIFMVQGGLESCCGSTGFLIGAGASFKPMKDNDKFEAGGDVNFGRSNGVNNLYFSFNGQYDMHLQNSKAVPFVGGGIGILHASAGGFSNTDTALQILGGVDFETSGGRALRAQIRFLFTTDTTTVVLVGFAF